MDMKTSAFCNRLKKVICGKIEIGNTHHIKLKTELLRKSRSKEPMFWEVQTFLPPISPVLQYKVEAHNPFRSTGKDIQNCVCVCEYIHIYIYIYIYSYATSFVLKWWQSKSREKGGNDNDYRVPILAADKLLLDIVQIYLG